MEKINNFFENFSNGIYWVLIGIIVALIVATAALFLYAFLVKIMGMNEHKHATAVRNAFATWMTGGFLSLIAIVFFDSSQSIISMTFVEPYFVIFFFSSLIAAFKMFGTKTKNSDSNAILKFVDLGLPSGKLWATENIKDEDGNEAYVSFDKAVETFGDTLPTKEDWKELFEHSIHQYDEGRKGIVLTGPNGNAIFLPAKGFYGSDSKSYNVGESGEYWSSSHYNEPRKYAAYFSSNCIIANNPIGSNLRLSIRLTSSKML